MKGEILSLILFELCPLHRVKGLSINNVKKIETNFQPKFTRNDRFAQMSHQEKLIEQKKKEILAKIEANKGDTNKPKPETVKPALKR